MVFRGVLPPPLTYFAPFYRSPLIPKGAKQVTVPKVGQMQVDDLTDGVDIIDEQEIGMTTVDLTAAEVGAKVILTDKLVREQQNNVFSIIGRQLGDAMARKKDTDVHSLYSSLNGSDTLGAAAANMTDGAAPRRSLR